MKVVDIAALPPDACLTAKQVADVTGFSPFTIKNWRHRGRGPKVTTISGKPRYRAADVRRFMGVDADTASPASPASPEPARG